MPQECPAGRFAGSDEAIPAFACTSACKEWTTSGVTNNPICALRKLR